MLDLARPLPKADLKLTEEMQAVIEHLPTSHLKVEAGAGVGKTTLLVRYANVHSKYRGLYISFNAAIAKEATNRFPQHIDCMTAHGYAFKALGVGRHKGRLVNRIRRNHIREANFNLLNEHLSEDRMVKSIIAGLENFTNSAGTILTVEHCNLAHAPRSTQDRVMPTIARAIMKFVNYDEGDLPFTHDCYLKRLEMTGAMGSEYDYLLVDEAQDLNPILLSLIRKSGRPVIMVGDRKQSIYAFRGSVDAMSHFEAPSLPLSQSWRFGAPVDAISNFILAKTSEPPEWLLKGRPDHTTEVTEYAGSAPANSLILSRTNSRLFEGLVNIKVPFHVIGGFDVMATQLLSALALSRGDRKNIRDQLVMSYRNWEEMAADAKDGDDAEVRRLVKIVEDHGGELENIIERLRGLHRPSMGEARLTLSTSHKAKGLESPTVIVLDDFLTPQELLERRAARKLSYTEYDQELHLLYVSVTRALDQLQLSSALFKAFEDIVRKS